MTDLLCKEGNFCQIHVLLDKKMLKFVPFLSKNMSTFLNLSGKKACKVRKLHLDNKY